MTYTVVVRDRVSFGWRFCYTCKRLLFMIFARFFLCCVISVSLNLLSSIIWREYLRSCCHINWIRIEGNEQTNKWMRAKVRENEKKSRNTCAFRYNVKCLWYTLTFSPAIYNKFSICFYTICWHTQYSWWKGPFFRENEFNVVSSAFHLMKIKKDNFIW